MLDIEVSGAIAPGAKIVAYFADNTDAGFLNAITTAVHDSTNNPSVVSISWGGPESSWTQQAMTSMDEAFQAAAAMGVTVCVASGDDGSTDGVSDGSHHVDFPASSPNVLACGGTTLQASGGKITSETAWNELASNEGATGGGISDVFPLPSWQNGVNVPPSANPKRNVGRGVPDVSGDADPTTGYVTLVDGQSGVIGGTSAVAPLWAGLVALINHSIGKPVGFINPLLYQNASTAGDFHDITSGSNGAYQAGPGWDACTGLGSPIGTGVGAVLGVPQQAKLEERVRRRSKKWRGTFRARRAAPFCSCEGSRGFYLERLQRQSYDGTGESLARLGRRAHDAKVPLVSLCFLYEYIDTVGKRLGRDCRAPSTSRRQNSASLFTCGRG